MGRCSLILFVVLLLGAPEGAHAFGRSLRKPCAPVVKKADPEKYPSMISSADPARSTLLPNATIKNQNKYGCCWISSTLGKWERIAEAKFGHPISLSENHMILASLFYRVREGIYFGSEIIQGGWTETADWMAMFLGLVPESVCKWKVDLRTEGPRIVDELNKKIAAYQEELVSMRKTRASEEAVWRFTENTKAKILGELRDEVGNFPTKFTVDGKEYTPYSFARRLADEEDHLVRVEYEPIEPRVGSVSSIRETLVTKERSLFSLYPDISKFLKISGSKFEGVGKDSFFERYRLFGKTHLPKIEAPRDTPAGRPINPGYRNKRVRLDVMHDQIDASIAEGRPVLLSTGMVREYYRSETGIFSLKAHGATSSDAKYAKANGYHAVLITGVYRDHAGSVLGYRIQNSWGSSAGSGGYFFMDVDYFDAFVTGIVVKSKT